MNISFVDSDKCQFASLDKSSSGTVILINFDNLLTLDPLERFLIVRGEVAKSLITNEVRSEEELEADLTICNVLVTDILVDVVFGKDTNVREKYLESVPEVKKMVEQVYLLKMTL